MFFLLLNWNLSPGNPHCGAYFCLLGQNNPTLTVWGCCVMSLVDMLSTSVVILGQSLLAHTHQGSVRPGELGWWGELRPLPHALSSPQPPPGCLPGQEFPGVAGSGALGQPIFKCSSLDISPHWWRHRRLPLFISGGCTSVTQKYPHFLLNECQ